MSSSEASRLKALTREEIERIADSLKGYAGLDTNDGRGDTAKEGAQKMLEMWHLIENLQEQVKSFQTQIDEARSAYAQARQYVAAYQWREGFPPDGERRIFQMRTGLVVTGIYSRTQHKVYLDVMPEAFPEDSVVAWCHLPEVSEGKK